MKIKPNTKDNKLTRKILGFNEDLRKHKIDVVEERPLTLYLNSQEIVTMMTVNDYPKYLALEKLTKNLSKKIWIYSFNKENIKPTSVSMIGRNENLMAEHKIANFQAVEIQIFDVEFNRSTFTLEPKILRKIKFLK